jgi:23S rRNA (cytosine1962-C5)-methyltransferase
MFCGNFAAVTIGAMRASLRHKPLTAPVRTTQRPLDQPREIESRVRINSLGASPLIFRKRLLGPPDPPALPGDLVALIDPQHEPLGFGFFNPKSEVAVRVLRAGKIPPDDAFWDDLLKRAVRLRRETLKLDEVTNTYRLIHAEGDWLPGIVIDRYGDTLSAEAFGLGLFQRGQAILERLAKIVGAKHWLLRPGPYTEPQEGFAAEPVCSPELPRSVVVQEFGTKFRVEFIGGHKTGFFCDQRDNRRRLADFTAGKSVLDLCCYTGGFSITAKRLGNAADVTGVDLDEQPLKIARGNAQLNAIKASFVQADVFPYMRDMIRHGRQFDVVVLDPPKLIRNRAELDEGTRRHFDLNRLAMQLVKPGGLLLSCSCSGLLPDTEFLRLLYSASRQAGDPFGPADNNGFQRRGPRDLQLLFRTGAAPDHPVSANYPESDYLKAAWLRLN